MSSEDGPSEHQVLHGLVLEATGHGDALLADFDAWCAAREVATDALEACAQNARRTDRR